MGLRLNCVVCAINRENHSTDHFVGVYNDYLVENILCARQNVLCEIFLTKINSAHQPPFLAAPASTAVALSRHGGTKWAELKCAVTTSHFSNAVMIVSWRTLKPRLHDTAGCQTGCTTGLTAGCIV